MSLSVAPKEIDGHGLLSQKVVLVTLLFQENSTGSSSAPMASSRLMGTTHSLPEFDVAAGAAPAMCKAARYPNVMAGPMVPPGPG